MWWWFYVYFFVFKLKAAYEMRISDWSSDVCSSDLRRRLPQPSAHWLNRGQAALPAWLAEGRYPATSCYVWDRRRRARSSRTQPLPRHQRSRDRLRASDLRICARLPDCPCPDGYATRHSSTGRDSRVTDRRHIAAADASRWRQSSRLNWQEGFAARSRCYLPDRKARRCPSKDDYLSDYPTG